MKKRLAAIFLLLFTALIPLAADESASVSLSSGWEYSLTGADKGFSPLSDSELSSLERVVPGKTGMIWLRKQFTLPAQLSGERLACYLGRITMADRTWINNIYIGGKGRFPPNEFSAWNTARLYSIPDTAIHSGAQNTLLVQIWVEGEGSIVSHPFIGTSAAAERAAAFETFWNSKLNILFAFLMIIIAIYHFILFCKRPAEKESLYFAIINIVSALYMSVFYLDEIPGMPAEGMSFLWFQKLFSSSMPFIIAFLITSFVNSFLSHKDNKLILVLRYAIFIIPVVLSLAMPDYAHLRALRTYTQPFLIPPVLYILYIIVSAAVKKQKESIPLLAGFSPLVITVLLDLLLHDGLGLYQLPYFTSYGWQLVIIALLFLLAGRFADSRTQVEYLNQHLEQKVEERTNELSAANKQLSEVNTQLGEANERAEKDMKLAVFVQQSFYPRKAPSVNGWDIAYRFQPMSGVSGDLYDFFTDGNKLNGVALFDVSGHGISSGLVTMLAKTVIEREFVRGETMPLPRVVSSINKSLIAEKGDIQNYLTGLVIRTTENKVEYVNAGHPSIFYRTAVNGTVVPVETKDHKTGEGGIIGIDGLDDEFSGIGFSMRDGDALILYTDCLNEATDENGEQFGGDRIKRAFAESGSGSAEEKLGYVLSQLTSFTGGKPLNDDLTVIIMQRTAQK